MKISMLFVLSFWACTGIAASITIDRRINKASTAKLTSKSLSFTSDSFKPDPFVSAAPLIISVVCNDGVLLIALHSIFSREIGSTLLYKSYQCKYNRSDGDNIVDVDVSTDIDVDELDRHCYHKDGVEMVDMKMKDLPKSYRGPFRIHALDASGTTAIVCAGWRTDCEYLTKCVRSIDKKERLVFGDSDATMGMHGAYLACQASLLLSELCISESRRSLCCVGLIAAGGKGLWLIDSTGAYRVRAHAVGHGADRINDHLKKKDWTKLDCNEAAVTLLRTMFATKDNHHDRDGLEENDTNEYSNCIVPEGSLVEIAIVGKPGQNKIERKMKRLFTSEIFSIQPKHISRSR